MARIPFQNKVSARSAGPSIAPGAFQATAKATATLMGAVDGAAQMVKAQFDKAQDIQNHTDISTKHREIRNAKGKFMNEMAGVNEDGSMGQAVPPAEWGPKWSQRLRTLEGELGLDKTPPVVRRAVEDKFKDFTSSSYIEIAGQAIKANRREAAQNLDRDIADAKQRGDFGAVDQLLAEAGDIIPAEQISDARRSNRTAQSTAARADEMNEDPAAFIERMEGKGGNGLHSGVVRREIRAAKGIMSRNLSEDMDIVSDLVEAGEIADPADIEAELNKIDNIKPHQVKKLLAGYKEDTPLSKVERSEYRSRFRKLKADFLETRDFDAYEDGWMELNIELTAEGKRVGAGDLRGLLYQATPDNFAREGKTSIEDQKKMDAKLAPIREVGETVAEEYSKAHKARMLTKIRKATATPTSGNYEVGQTSGTSSLSDEDVEFNIALRRDAAIKAAEIEGIAAKSISEFIEVFIQEKGHLPVLPDVRAHMNDVVIPMLTSKHLSEAARGKGPVSAVNEDNTAAYEAMEIDTPQGPTSGDKIAAEKAEEKAAAKAAAKAGMFELEEAQKARLKALKNQ